ncbi:MAG: hypothetical protein IJP45_02460 [Paludibacteraceae bacterium]|nr:hypothetical protein [Paludibacteraceae bacterium]
MKKIMFKDKVGLTRAVLRREKTMTRRNSDMYEVGEEVAIAMSYKSMANGGYLKQMMEGPLKFKKEYTGAGWKNKMYVKAELMPRRVRILRKWQERLQDISDEDCMKEGIMEGNFRNTWDRYYYQTWGDVPNAVTFRTPREAFASLIDRVSGKGTWDSNPLVWCYEFELID